ncbi:PREDICTED: riboflavin synthase-like, partial [Priapulus caudatus]|uniref:Riboflavin synthase n=1 Tax=Priapulus caudatus TaxID=37621 RepID=A0ABM1F7P1_PRICU
SADVSRETLSLTSLAALSKGSSVNLEKALTLQTRLGGHLVSGHVDGLATVESRHADGRSERFRINAPAELAKYIAAKGSITIDGVSLTVNKLKRSIGRYQVGTKVNLEVDVVARYLERLLLGEKAAEAAKEKDNINHAFLAKHGFYKV